MRKIPFFQTTLALAVGLGATVLRTQAATDNNGNPPAFIMLDICSNGIGDQPKVDEQTPVPAFYPAVPRMSPDVFDIGLDIDADGTVDRWLSQEPATWLGGGNSEVINYGGWVRLYFFQLSEYAGRTMKIRIVDKSDQYYFAINSIRVNGVDGIVVPNPLSNGFFEDGLTGWTVKETSVSNAASLIVDDPAGSYVTYGRKFLSTRIDPASEDSTATAVIESEAFVLPYITSFIYGNVSGGVSEFVNNPGANESDNKSGVYLDLGTTTENPNGRFDSATDIALQGFWPGSGSGPDDSFGSILINTSGLEGRRAQVVAFDDSTVFSVAIDAFRMNWDWQEQIIRNGGFDEGIPTPPSTDPNAGAWYSESLLPYTSHPSGKIPGWTVKLEPGASANAWFFDDQASHDHMTGRTFIGTGGGDRLATGVEIRSDVFNISPIPNRADSVFVQFASAQGTDRIRYQDETGAAEARGRIQLVVDVNANDIFGDAGDFTYVQHHQGMAPNQSNSGRDLWHFPQYRWYIKPEHQGLKAQFSAEDTFGPFKASWGWICVDDLFVWNGSTAALAFENSDFEKGSLLNWNAAITSSEVNPGFTSWLSGSVKSLTNNVVNHLAMNDRSVNIDGDFAADTGANEVADGDAGTGKITSVAFALPRLTVTPPSLQLISNGGSLSLVWTSPGVLQTSESISAGWAPVTGATSPYPVPTTTPSRYYRLIQ